MSTPRLLQAALRACLRLAPREFRDRFEGPILATVEDGYGAARARGVGAAFAYALRTLADLPVQAVGAWRGRRRSTGGGTMAGRWEMDVRHALRALLRRPGTAAVGLAILGLGVGAAATVATVVHAVLLSPLDMPEDDRLVVLRDRNVQNGLRFSTTGGAYLTWKFQAESFESVAAMSGATMNLTEPGLTPERVEGARVSANYFEVLGIEPLLGRAFRPEEERGEHRVMVLSHALWTGRYGGDPDVVGTTVDADGEAWKIIGVAPPVAVPMGWRMDLVDGERVRTAWVPMNLEEEWQTSFRSHILVALARLAPGVSVARARTELEGMAPAIAEAHPDDYTNLTAHVVGLREATVGDVRADLWVLLAGIVLVLLAGCINLANLLLVRGMDRRRERAVRRALGAGRGSLLRLAALEGLLLGAGGAVLAVAVLSLGVSGLEVVLPEGLPRREQVGLGPWATLLTPAVALTLGVGVGTLASLLGTDPGEPGPGSGRRTTAGRREQRISRGLVVGQVALAFALLGASGLLFKSFHSLAETDPGFEAGNTLVVELLLPPGRYPDRASVSEFFRTLERRVEALPGVRQALTAYDPPTEGTWMERFSIVGDPPPAAGEAAGGYFRPVSPGWFEALSIPVVAGRTLDESHELDGPPSVVVNETWVRRHMPDRDPLGARIEMATARNNWGPRAPIEWEVVGVVSDVRFRGLREHPGAAMYFSVRQAPTTFTRLLVQAAGDAEAVLPGLRGVLQDLDPRLPISGATTLAAALESATAQDRFNALLLVIFALAALFVASAGLYGVLAYAVARRRTEVGVRMAMGAAPGRVWRMLVLEGMGLALAGLLGGLALALLAGGALGSVLYGVSPRDPFVLGAVGAVLGASALLAAAVPATRAARAHPAAALLAD